MKQTYWFRAKPHGGGWDLPLTWQGWAVYAIALVLHVAVFVVWPPFSRPVAFMAGTWAIVALLITICWVKGEPSKWRPGS